MFFCGKIECNFDKPAGKFPLEARTKSMNLYFFLKKMFFSKFVPQEMKTWILTILTHFFHSLLDEIYPIRNFLNRKFFSKSSCGNVGCYFDNLPQKFLFGAGKKSWTYNFFHTKNFPSKCSCGEVECRIHNPAQNFSTEARRKLMNI